MSLSRLGEFGLIHRLRSHLRFRSPQTIQGIGDDCAVFKSSAGTYLIASTDALVEDVHFTLDTTTPEELGRKAMSVNLSDLAAMGGKPTGALVSLAVPSKITAKFLDRLYAGIDERCRQYRCELTGGDTVRSPGPLFINITVLGEVRENRLFTRTGAQPGDLIFVTGTLGDSALGLHLLSTNKSSWTGPAQDKKFVRQRHVDPTPRLRESALLARGRSQITSMIDVSDGFLQDLRHLLEPKGLGARILEEQLPASPAMTALCAKNRKDSLDYILAGGEDYELLFTSPPKDAKNLMRQFTKAGTPLSHVGDIVGNKRELSLIRNNGTVKNLRAYKGFDHFKAKTP